MILVEVVEPTLVSEAGHCAANFTSLRAAAPELSFRLWIDRRAELAELGDGKTELRRYFSRRWRKLQAWWVYRSLLRGPNPVLIPTASYFDLRALDAAAAGAISPGRVFLYFHKMRMSASRSRALAELARRQPNWELFGTSDEIVERLRAAGFSRVTRMIPVVSKDPPGGATAGPVPFRYLLSAGAARADKGFSTVVDMVALLAKSHSSVPILVQSSGDHYGRYDEKTQADVARLRGIAYAPLVERPDTLTAAQYAELFPGSICLLPYAPQEYADKMSSVLFDAMRAGAPVVTAAGTTMARIVEESGAGLVVDRVDAGLFLTAAQSMIPDYAAWSARARAAGARFDPNASWAPLANALRAAVRR